MSIVPAGNRKDQVAQGAFKNESIFDAIMSKVALTPGNVDMPTDVAPDVKPDLQNAMNDSKSRLNADEGAVPGVGSGAPQEQPGMGQNQDGMMSGGTTHQDFAIIARELSQFLEGSEVLSRDYVLVDQKRDQRVGRWTFVIEPAQAPNLQEKVTPNGPPLGAPAGGGGGGEVVQSV